MKSPRTSSGACGRPPAPGGSEVGHTAPGFPKECLGRLPSSTGSTAVNLWSDGVQEVRVRVRVRVRLGLGLALG